ncbi:MAG: PadR family transcriptional regulator [Vicinamibacterales bacterium]
MPGPDTPRVDLVPGTLEMLALRVLAVEPLHGYAIAQQIHRSSRAALTIEEGSLYPALQRMLIKGWVKAAWKTSATGRRARIYTITAAGRRQLGEAEARFHATFAAVARVLKG